MVSLLLLTVATASNPRFRTECTWFSKQLHVEHLWPSHLYCSVIRRGRCSGNGVGGGGGLPLVVAVYATSLPSSWFSWREPLNSSGLSKNQSVIHYWYWRLKRSVPPCVVVEVLFTASPIRLSHHLMGGEWWLLGGSPLLCGRPSSFPAVSPSISLFFLDYPHKCSPLSTFFIPYFLFMPKWSNKVYFQEAKKNQHTPNISQPSK